MIKRNHKIAIALALTFLTAVGVMNTKINMSASSNVGWVQASNGSWNYLKSDGSKTTGWYSDNGTWYYFYSDGTMATGWLQSGSNWYYMLKDGSMAVNTKVDGYYINSSGVYSTNAPTSPIYNGNDIKQKLYSLGFINIGGGLGINPYGANGGANWEELGFTTGSDGRDMTLLVYKSSSDIDKKIKTICNWIFPTQGDYAYDTLDKATGDQQTFEIEGRTVTLTKHSYGIDIDFGPIK